MPGSREDIKVGSSAESDPERVRSARRRLGDAAKSHDPSALADALDALEGALRAARVHGVAFPAPGEAEAVEAVEAVEAQAGSGTGEGERG